MAPPAAFSSLLGFGCLLRSHVRFQRRATAVRTRCLVKRQRRNASAAASLSLSKVTVTGFVCEQVGEHDPLVNTGGSVRAPCSHDGDAASSTYDVFAAIEQDSGEARSSCLNAHI
ncbi:uncharacterized protein [Triticum aestivum]|uniref:uncharacterized protein n=1 Tax=Triticum aestivum TaxID=4565 RepID=UPI00098B6FA7|nr:uncharacterized protein LOC109766999 [Aegilops tauschii subsp. strangulata]XP_044378267.1 uncharacterized protein LOC123100395 [Triticum aestivum]